MKFDTPKFPPAVCPVMYIEFFSRSGDAGDFMGYVLAKSHDGYATWRYSRQHGETAERYWGRYFNHLTEAIVDYMDRATEFVKNYPHYELHSACE